MRRRKKVDDWNPAKLDADVARWRRISTRTTIFAVALNALLALANLAMGNWWVTGISVAAVAFNLATRARDVARHAETDKRRHAEREEREARGRVRDVTRRSGRARVGDDARRHGVHIHRHRGPGVV